MARIGLGKDIHIFKKGYPFVLGGVKIPYKKGLISYADGDCLIHSLVDAILGSLGKEDIGTLFPNNDPKYKGISSRFYLKECKKYLEESKYKISNIDIFISLEEPVLKPYILEMKKVISEDLNVEIKDISIKAGTNEKMGYIGKKKACECISVVLLEEEK